MKPRLRKVGGVWMCHGASTLHWYKGETPWIAYNGWVRDTWEGSRWARDLMLRSFMNKSFRQQGG